MKCTAIFHQALNNQSGCWAKESAHSKTSMSRVNLTIVRTRDCWLIMISFWVKFLCFPRLPENHASRQSFCFVIRFITWHPSWTGVIFSIAWQQLGAEAHSSHIGVVELSASAWRKTLPLAPRSWTCWLEAPSLVPQWRVKVWEADSLLIWR